MLSELCISFMIDGFLRAGASWYFLEKLGWLTVNSCRKSGRVYANDVKYVMYICIPPRHLWLFCLCTKEAPVKENGKRRENKVNNANKSDSGRSESSCGTHERTNERVQNAVKSSIKRNKIKAERRERHHRRRKVEMEKETGEKSTKKRRIIIYSRREKKKKKKTEWNFIQNDELGPWLGDASAGGWCAPGSSRADAGALRRVKRKRKRKHRERNAARLLLPLSCLIYFLFIYVCTCNLFSFFVFFFGFLSFSCPC